MIRRKHKPAHWNRIPGSLDPCSHFTKDGREVLFGKDKSKRRAEIFKRAGGRCEDSIKIDEFHKGRIIMTVRCNLPITWESMEWSHNRHGKGFRDDSLNGGIASCHECHRRRHAGVKSCPKKSLQSPP